MKKEGPDELTVDGVREYVARVAALPSDWTTDGERLVLLVLACDGYTKEKGSGPGLDNLASWTGMNRRSVAKILDRLQVPNSNRPALLAKLNTSKGKVAIRYRLLSLPTANSLPSPTAEETSSATNSLPSPTAEETSSSTSAHTSAHTSAYGETPLPLPLNTLSPAARVVASVLRLKNDDERLSSIPQMLEDNHAKDPVAWIRTCARNGDLERLLEKAHEVTCAAQQRAIEADKNRCPHGVINGIRTGQCEACMDAMDAAAAS